jgi:starch synthase
MKILFAASEVTPFAKTGGLADVAGALPLALKAKKHDVRLVMPKYKSVDVKAFGLVPTDLLLRIPMGDAVETVRLWEGKLEGKIPVTFIDAPKYFDRDGLYRDAKGLDYPDNDERFILFSRAVLEAAKAVDFRPDIVHVHDWQTGLIPAYLETLYLLDAFYLPTASVFTIHNIAYQGLFPKNTLFEAGFSWSDFTQDRLEFYDQVNFLKAGLVFAHQVNTVSPTYAREVISDPKFGRGMEGVLLNRGADFTGILNGLDPSWNPEKDPFLHKPFSAKALDDRAACKADLQKAVGLKENAKMPLLGMVSRLDPQKGVDLALLVLGDELMRKGIQVVFLGQGEPSYEAALRDLAAKFPGQAATVSEFSEPIAHKIYGGADIFLMPSRFEPCGLGQMIALRYGCVPVVTPTGGLADTVESFDPAGKGVGFVSREAGTRSYADALAQALTLYRTDPASWQALQRRGMTADYGWGKSVDRYVDLYERALERKRSLH